MVDAVLGVVLGNLNSLIQSQFGLIWGVQNDMEKLSSILSTIRDVLEDAEQQQILNKPIANWLQKLKDAAYDAEDVLDEWSTARARGSDRDPGNKSFSKHASELVLSSLNFKKIIFQRNVGRKIKEVISKFDEISAERSKFHLNSGVVSNRVQFDPNRETTSFLAEEVVYGRDADREKIIDILRSHEEDVSVLPILGIGGLGKTTLAQLVYQDQRMANHFDARIWVCVSTDFQVKRVTQMVLESLSGRACDLQSLDSIQKQLQENLRQKKFLLVLDDVWNDDHEKWARLKFSLTCGAKGSSIIVTTRLEIVTDVTGTLPPHRLASLSEEDCWSLFRRLAFGMENQDIPDLVDIGKQIVKKCSGVPLAAKTLGGLMFLKREVNEWLHVRDSQIWELPQDKEGDILPALMLSYNHLPPNWRQCFAFCSIYPQDYVMGKENLIQLWMANKFLQSDGRVELEDLGNQVFNELLRRSFFQDTEEDAFGNIKTCKMHDLMHDLACLVSRKECSVVEAGKAGTFPKRIRHRSLVGNYSAPGTRSDFQCLSEPSAVLRTQLLLHGNRIYMQPQIFFEKFQCLRVLDVSGLNMNVLPVSVGKLKHMRYLNLSKTGVGLLPESICKLRNLQSLKLTGCRNLRNLPIGLSRMTGLRHLDIEGCSRLTEMPTGMGQLTELRTLSIFVVGSDSGRKMKELQGLNNLRGELTIKGLENVGSTEEAKEANLNRKQNLSSLKLCWSEDGSDGELHEKVTNEGLQPHPKLKMLHIFGYKGEKLPSWMSMLVNLIEIQIKNCSSCRPLPPLGPLPLLKVLIVSGMKSVKCMGDDFYGVGCFPSLEKIGIFDMSDLEEWSACPSAEAFPCLEILWIVRCPKLAAFPFFPCVQHLVLERCNEMILRSVGNLPSLCLSSLKIEGFEELKSIPEEIENLTALTMLEIGSCRELVFLPGALQNLISLVQLQIGFCDNIKCLPEGIQHLTLLKSMRIINCKNVTRLPEWLQHLPALEYLFIRDCSAEMHLRCQKHKGDDWHIISHIPHFIDGSPYPTPTGGPALGWYQKSWG